MNHETAVEIEYDIAMYFGPARYVIIPNVYWSILPWECDLALLTKSNYLYEVEIKISKQDLMRDRAKRKWVHHDGYKTRKTWFAIPEKLRDCVEYIPEKAGVLVVSKTGVVSQIREARTDTKARKLYVSEQLRFMRLGSLRMWTLKKVLLQHMELKDKEKIHGNT